ncbi:MAG: hypothetical protein U9Q70_03510 [Chloroflexota bacterium]|nr:hypothetical protein [Chloroflexota bacterium]
MRRRIGIFIGIGLLVLLVGGCGTAVKEEDAVALSTPIILSQWALQAEASSEYGRPNWSAARATGAPDVPACRDDARAWASARGNGMAWLELSYAEAVFATEVRVYQTLGRGGIARVLLLDNNGGEHLVWEGTDQTRPCPGVLTVSLSRESYLVTGVRVELDESRTGFWNEIDAVELVGVH